jgi:sugar lactone lactonase YvrE
MAVDFAVETAASFPQGIAAGPDRDVWFTERAGSKIASINSEGKVAEYLVPQTKAKPVSIVMGPDANLWVTDVSSNRIWQVLPDAPTAGPTTAGSAHTPTPTTTPVEEPAPCAGDCDHSGQITVDELVILINIALGNASLSLCTTGDVNGDGQITIDEILAAVDDILAGCSATPIPSAQVPLGERK